MLAKRVKHELCALPGYLDGIQLNATICRQAYGVARRQIVDYVYGCIKQDVAFDILIRQYLEDDALNSFLSRLVVQCKWTISRVAPKFNMIARQVLFQFERSCALSGEIDNAACHKHLVPAAAIPKYGCERLSKNGANGAEKYR